jgi:phage terminase small subunit
MPAKRKPAKSKRVRPKRSPKSQRLTPKQQRFVEELLADRRRVATQAYKRAYPGVTDGTARVESTRLMAHPKVIAAIAAADAERSNRMSIRQDQVIEELLLLLQSSHKDYVVDDNGNLGLAEGVPEEAIRAVSSVEVTIRPIPGTDGQVERKVRYKLWDKTAAVKMAGEHLGLFVKKIAPVNPDGRTPYDAGVAGAAPLLADARAALERFRRNSGSLPGPTDRGPDQGPAVVPVARPPDPDV